MRTSKTVADLNNEAVSFLQGGNYQAAVVSLQNAMELLYKNPTWQETIKNKENLAECVTSLRVQSLPIAALKATARGASHQINVFEFYRRSFYITSSPFQQSIIHPISNLIVVKFNMAIAYHDDGIRRNIVSHLMRAQALYEEILSLMHTYGIRGHMLLIMAIGNNLGHIHSHLLNFQQTREALYWVRQLAIACEQHVSSIPYHEFSFFYKTVVVFNGNDLNAAPAA